MAARKLEVAIIGDADKLSKTFRGAGKDATSFGSRLRVNAGGGLSFMAKSAGIGALALTAGLGLAIKGVIGDLSAHEKASAQTSAAIKSTGNAANVSTGHIESLADKIEKLSGADDVATQQGENMLLTFTNIRNGVGKSNQIFDQAVGTMADFAQATGIAAPKAAVLLGKALNDPIKGVSALSRVGVTFTEGQKKQIAAMVKSGDTMGAQKLILGELNKEFGGSAKAAGETMGGQLAILQARLMDVGDAIGERAIPALNNILTWANTEWVKFGPMVTDAANQAVEWFKVHWPEIQRVIGEVFDGAKRAWENIGKPAIQDVAEIVGAVVGLVRAHWNEISASTKFAFDQIKSIVTPALQTIQATVKLITDVIKGDWSAAWGDVKDVLVGVFDTIKAIIKADVAVWGTLAKLLGDKIVEGVKAGLSDLASGVSSLVSGAADRVAGFADDMLTRGRHLGDSIVSGARNGLADIVSTVTGRIGDALGAIDPGDWLSKGAAMARNLVSGALDGLASLPGRILTLLKGAVNGAIDTLRGFNAGGQSIGFSVNTHIPGVGNVGASFQVPDFHPFGSLPKLARGGVTTGRTAAIIGDNSSGREAVLPLDDRRSVSALRAALAGAGGGASAPLIGEVHIHGGDVDETALAARLDWTLRTAGAF